jgi:DNA-binding NarL/FixJ family response regulator
MWHGNCLDDLHKAMHNIEMSPLPAILICDRDALFREALRNFLFAAGYSQVEVAVTVREALAKLRRECYGYALIGVSRPLSRVWRLARVVQRRQPGAKIIFLVSADDQPFIEGPSFEYVIKEYVFSNLLDLI